MDQVKIGTLLKTLRKEKGVTQEHLADQLGVTNRSVSRWETGANLPDFDLLMDLAAYYEIGIEELLNGERKDDHMDNKTEEMMLKVAEYDQTGFLKSVRRMHYCFILGALSLVVFFILQETGLYQTRPYSFISGFSIGLAFGTLLGGILLTSRYRDRICAFKRRLLMRGEAENCG